MVQKEILAKTNPKESLLDHSLKTLEKAEKLVHESQIENDELHDICLISSLFHDIGKCTQSFQDHLLGHTNNGDYLKHNMISFKIFDELIIMKEREIGEAELMEDAKNIVLKSILLHHPIANDIIYNDQLQDINGINVSDIKVAIDIIDDMIQIINPKLNIYQLKRRSEPKATSRNKDFSYFVKNRDFNSFLNVSNGIVRFADILASKDSTMDEYVDFTFDKSKIKIHKPKSYDNRFYKHLEYAKQMHTGQFFHLFAPTGYGKTMINVLWMLMGDRKTIYVAPTNEIARSNYNSITKELQALGLEAIVKVGLLLTNKWEFGEELNDKNDIIVTNIDNFVRPLFKSDKRKSMCFNFNFCNVVFDEYHQYASNTAMMAAFDIALYGRSFCMSSKTIMTSATPNEYLYKSIKNITKNIPVDYVEYGSKKYKCEFRNFDSERDVEDFVMIFNSVKTAQSKCKPGWVNYHSLFTQNNKEEIRNYLNKIHGKQSLYKNRKTPVVCTNILSTGIDISFQKMIECGIPMEEIIQIAGRCNRWNEYPNGGILIFSNSEQNKSEMEAINNKYNTKLRDLEHQLLREKIGNKTITMNELYDIVKSIKNDDNYKIQFNDYMKKCLNASYDNLSKITYDYSNYEVESNELIISEKPSIRSTEKRRENETSLFVTVKGCDGYIQKNYLSTDALFKNHFEYMYDYVKKHKLEDVYGKHFKPTLKVFDKYLDLAKHSSTPFILNDRYFFYTKEKGLQEYSK